MPSAEHKSAKNTSKRGSLTGEKNNRKTSPKKKKKSSKKSGSKTESSQKTEEVLEVEGLSFPKEGDESDASVSRTPLLSNVSPTSQPITVKSETTNRGTSSDSSSTKLLEPSTSKTKLDKSVDNLCAKLSNVNLKQKSNKSKSKSSKKDSAKNTNKKTVDSISSKSSITMPNILEVPLPENPGPVINESIRWENELENLDAERERIHLYKINRRKRYLAAAQDKGLGWVKQYGLNGFPLNDECGVIEATKREPAILGLNEYSSIQVVRSNHAVMNN